MQAKMAISKSEITLIGRFGHSALEAPDMRAVVAEALRVIRRLTPATELRIVYASASRWKEWHATGRRVRDYDHEEWPSPSPAAQTTALETGNDQYGFVSISPATADNKWVLELMAPHVLAALTLKSTLLRTQNAAQSETERVRIALRAREDERRRITHELHDDVGQTIATLKLKLKVLQDRIQKHGSGPEIAVELTDARKSVGSLMSKIRDVSHTLYPRILDTMGFVPALEELIGQVSSPSEIEARCSVRGEPRPMDKDTTVSLYRCCQEAISNAIRHSKTSTLAVRIYFSDTRVRVVVEDTGRGFDPRRFYDSSGKLMSSGFWTIRQRMNDMDGSFRIGTALGKGTSIEMIVPFKDER